MKAIAACAAALLSLACAQAQPEGAAELTPSAAPTAPTASAAASLPHRTAVAQDLGGAKILRVSEDGSGIVTTLFDRPVRLVGGEVFLITNRGYAPRLVETDPGGYSYTFRFDVGSLGKGELVVDSLYLERGARIVSVEP